MPITACQYLNMLANEQPQKLTPAMRQRLATCNPSTASAIEQDLFVLFGPAGFAKAGEAIGPKIAARLGTAGSAAGAGAAAAKTLGGKAASTLASSEAKKAAGAAAFGGLFALDPQKMTEFMIRVGEILLGAALLLLGLRAMTGGSGDPMTLVRQVARRV